jgi:hypothetical protein
MTRRQVGFGLATVTIVLLAIWGLTRGLERIMTRPPAPPAGDADRRPPPAASPPVRHITATLFYGSSDGQYLVPVQREVPFGETTVEQGRQIVVAQLELPPPSSLIAPVPAGATLRSFYVSERGDAFVDLGPEIVAKHPGGSLAELFTVFAIVNAVTANLPAISRVQILVDGKEAETLAGHVDLRRPLERNDALVQQDTARTQ